MNSLKLLHTIRKYGTSYAIATAFFPKLVRDRVLLLYSFVRYPDNIVDQDIENLNQEQKREHYQRVKQELEKQFEDRKTEYQAGVSDYSLLFKNNQIPFEYSESFYKAMIQDCTKHEYHNYEELEDYMYGSAVVIGLMMNRIVGVTDPVADEYATALGQAMQLTNFLRDIKEDKEKLGRSYIYDDIQTLCNKARTLYRKAELGYKYLPNYAIKPISLASNLYEGILDKIEANHFDVFTKSARTTIFDKLKIIRTWRKKQKQSVWSDEESVDSQAQYY